MDIPDLTTLKRCSKCGEDKPRDQFYKCRRRNDGLQAWCKACSRERIAEYRKENAEHISEYKREYRRANAEDIAEYMQEYRQENAERLREYSHDYWRRNGQYKSEYKREYDREYRQKNAERLSDKRHKYYETNAARINKQRREYNQTPQGKAEKNERDNRRRARKSEADGSYTAADLVAIRAAQTDKRGRLICWRCGKPITDTPHIDHWIPLKHGGQNDPGNLHYMHAKCNLSKGAKHPTEIGRLL